MLLLVPQTTRGAQQLGVPRLAGTSVKMSKSPCLLCGRRGHSYANTESAQPIKIHRRSCYFLKERNAGSVRFLPPPLPPRRRRGRPVRSRRPVRPPQRKRARLSEPVRPGDENCKKLRGTRRSESLVPVTSTLGRDTNPNPSDSPPMRPARVRRLLRDPT